MDQGALEHWEAFFQAQVGASAALAGLIFVSVSISLKQVLSAPRLSDRAFQALMVLVKILIISSLMLAPQPMIVIGVEVLFVGLLVWAMVLRFDVRNLRTAEAAYLRRVRWRVFLSQTSALLYIASGAAILACGGVGIYGLIPALMGSYLVSVLDAWVLLIEINR